METAVKLYDLDVSGNCHKVRIFLSILGKTAELMPVDFMGGEHKRPPMTDLNPFGEIPIFVDGDLVLRESQAILVYLARKYDATAWLPIEAEPMARVMEWVMVGGNEIMRGPNDARLQQKFGYDIDHALAKTKAARILKLMDDRLKDREWLALDRPTIADIACYPYVSVGHEGGAPCADYPAIQAWTERLEGLPDFLKMPGSK